MKPHYDHIWHSTPMPESYTCGCGLNVHPSVRNPEAIHINDCSYSKMKTLAQLAEHVRGIAAAHPQAVYERPNGNCRYNTGFARDGEHLIPGCGCLIGRGLQTMGVDCAFLDKEYPGKGIGTIWRELEGDFGIVQTGNDLSWLHDVQFRQDLGEPWGYAIAYADSRRPAQ